MNRQLKRTQQRTVRYWFIDGLAELGGGCICLALAVLFWLQQVPPFSKWGFLLFFLAAFGFAYAMRWVILRRKEQSTYPRTGYLAYRSGWANKDSLAVVLVFALLVLVVNFYLILQGPKALVWMPAVGGLIFGFIFAWAGYQAALPRLYFLAIFCLLAGTGFALSGIGGLLGAALLSGLTGVVLLIFGGWARWNYLHHVAPLAENPNDH
jgi:hypothetical protein